MYSKGQEKGEQMFRACFYPRPAGKGHILPPARSAASSSYFLDSSKTAADIDAKPSVPSSASIQRLLTEIQIDPSN